MTRYEHLAEHLRGDIRNGLYAPGDRVPSVRRIAARHGVSVATGVAAYRQLEAQGWLEARPQSGFYARHPESLPTRRADEQAEPVPVTSGERMAQLLRATTRPGVLSLGSAIPQASFLPLAELNASLARSMRRQPAAAARYGDFRGEEALRVQIARRAAEAGCALGPDDLLVTTGCQEALMLALRATVRAGEVVAIESPAYFGTLQLIESLGLQALEIPTDPQTGLSPEALALALERWPIKACLMTANFCNPLGARMPDAHKRRIVRLLSARGIALIEDDIYGDLGFEGERPAPAKAFDAGGNVLLCSSFSKTLAPGMRIGWIAAGKWRKAVEQLKYGTTLATAIQPQLAVADYLQTSRYERHLAKVRRRYADNLARLQAAVLARFPPGTRTTRPLGGFILWVELPESCDALDMSQRALRAGISVAPGPLFSPRGNYANCIRLMAAVEWDARLEAALEELGRLAYACMPRRRLNAAASPSG